MTCTILDSDFEATTESAIRDLLRNTNTTDSTSTPDDTESSDFWMDEHLNQDQDGEATFYDIFDFKDGTYISPINHLQ